MHITIGMKSEATELDVLFPLERVANKRSSFVHTRAHVFTHYEARVKILNYKKLHTQSANRKNNISHHEYNRYPELNTI